MDEINESDRTLSDETRKKMSETRKQRPTLRIRKARGPEASDLKRFELEGYGYVESTAGPQSKTASKIYAPVEWTGKKVVVILLEK